MTENKPEDYFMRKSPDSIWILMGSCSADKEAYQGYVVTPGLTVEWQVSDGPSGQRSYSEDTLDPAKVFELVNHMRGENKDASVYFASHQERAFFLKSLMQRIAGVPVQELSSFPQGEWMNAEDKPVLVFGQDSLSVLIEDVAAAGQGAENVLERFRKPSPEGDNLSL